MALFVAAHDHPCLVVLPTEDGVSGPLFRLRVLQFREDDLVVLVLRPLDNKIIHE